MRLSTLRLGSVVFSLSMQAFSNAYAIAQAQDQYVASLRQHGSSDGIHLAVSPACGSLSGNASDVNSGIDLKRVKTIVAFGVRLRTCFSLHQADRPSQDSYTDGGRDDGGPLAPPVVVPPDAEAGGRSTDGKVWVENLADDIGATLMDYAVRICRVIFHLPIHRMPVCVPVAIRRMHGPAALAEQLQEGGLHRTECVVPGRSTVELLPIPRCSCNFPEPGQRPRSPEYVVCYLLRDQVSFSRALKL